MKELVVISGKGGTGKTSIVSSFAALAEDAVFADCDVDAADLNLILQPEILKKEEFIGGKAAEIIPELCSNCGLCLETCEFGAIIEEDNDNITFKIDPLSCEGCGVCHYVCPDEAIRLIDRRSGEWYISKTRFGPLVHAKLGIGGENSGKLVTQIRTAAKEIAEQSKRNLIIIDGSPGTGCPVIASITGVDMALIVTEPTRSGVHDMKRIFELCRHFHVRAYGCINKWDINQDISDEIEKWAKNKGMEILGKIDYDNVFTEAQIEKKSVVEFKNGKISRQINNMWLKIMERTDGRYGLI